MGDSIDFVEWSATVEMLANAKKQMAFLETEAVPDTAWKNTGRSVRAQA